MLGKGVSKTKCSQRLIISGFALALIACEAGVGTDRLVPVTDQGSPQNVSSSGPLSLQIFILNQIDESGEESFEIQSSLENPELFMGERLSTQIGQNLFIQFLSGQSLQLITDSSGSAFEAAPNQLSSSQISNLFEQPAGLNSLQGSALIDQDFLIPSALNEEGLPLGDPSDARTLGNCQDPSLSLPLRWKAQEPNSASSQIFLRFEGLDQNESIDFGPLEDSGLWNLGLINGTLAEALFSDRLNENFFVEEVVVSILRRVEISDRELLSSPRTPLRIQLEVQQTQLMSFIFDQGCHP